jgi:hypothetical protein
MKEEREMKKKNNAKIVNTGAKGWICAITQNSTNAVHDWLIPRE